MLKYKFTHEQEGSMKHTTKIETGGFNNADNDIVITLGDGMVVNVSYEFGCINIFKSRKDFDEFDLDKCRVIDLEE